MTAPDPKWVEAGAKASAQWHRNEDVWDSDDRALAYLILSAALPLIRAEVLADLQAKANKIDKTYGPLGSQPDLLLWRAKVIALFDE